jgi:CRP-like cAMP-binding protein
MKKFWPVLQKCPLFSDIEERDLQSLLACLAAAQKRFEENGFIFSVGDKSDSVGVVLSGAVHVLREDFGGNRSILTRVEPGRIVWGGFRLRGCW